MAAGDGGGGDASRVISLDDFFITRAGPSHGRLARSVSSHVSRLAGQQSRREQDVVALGMIPGPIAHRKFLVDQT